MPTYEYECRKCGLRFEKFQNITAKPLKRCRQCGGMLRRLIGIGAAVISRGSAGRSGDFGQCQKLCGRDGPCSNMEGPPGRLPCGR